MAKKLEASGRKAIVLIVHGYTMGFALAAMRTARLAHDFRFQGLAFLISWPRPGVDLSLVARHFAANDTRAAEGWT